MLISQKLLRACWQKNPLCRHIHILDVKEQFLCKHSGDPHLTQTYLLIHTHTHFRLLIVAHAAIRHFKVLTEQKKAINRNIVNPKTLKGKKNKKKTNKKKNTQT